MANELLAQSSSRDGATVLWVTIHTAEGPTDEFPSRPDLDAGSADDLLRFFEGKTDRSCHAIADDDKTLDDLVPYDRAAWTLRAGNRYSDNLEMCALASWTRDEWMQHTGMMDQAARWVARRCKARGFAARYIGAAGVRDRAKGYIDHNDYTVATGDGTHWDVGPNFPWDWFTPRVSAYYNGTDVEEGLFMALTTDQELEILRGARAASRVELMVSQNNTVGDVNTIAANVGQLLTALTAAGVDSAKRDAAVLGAIAALPAAGLDEDALAADLAPRLAELGINLDADTLVKAIRADLAAALAEPAA